MSVTIVRGKTGCRILLMLFFKIIVVHLGAMQHTVRYQMETLKDNLHRGDVILANHPKAGNLF